MRLRPRFRVKTLLVVVAALASAYVGSYHRLSRRGKREAADYNLPGFFYVPIEEASAKRDLTEQYALAVFYAPANWVDRQIFGGMYPIQCIMWELSG